MGSLLFSSLPIFLCFSVSCSLLPVYFQTNKKFRIAWLIWTERYVWDLRTRGKQLLGWLRASCHNEFPLNAYKSFCNIGLCYCFLRAKLRQRKLNYGSLIGSGIHNHVNVSVEVIYSYHIYRCFGGSFWELLLNWKKPHCLLAWCGWHSNEQLKLFYYSAALTSQTPFVGNCDMFSLVFSRRKIINEE